ncbi:hypothetical protein THAOC_19046, partial [Thalassiosira oceanica]
MERGNRDRAVKHWLISAKMGHKESVEKIKRAFKVGLATKEQYAQALKGYQYAVEQMNHSGCLGPLILSPTKRSACLEWTRPRLLTLGSTITLTKRSTPAAGHRPHRHLSQRSNLISAAALPVVPEILSSRTPPHGPRDPRPRLSLLDTPRSLPFPSSAYRAPPGPKVAPQEVASPAPPPIARKDHYLEAGCWGSSTRFSRRTAWAEYDAQMQTVSRPFPLPGPLRSSFPQRSLRSVSTQTSRAGAGLDGGDRQTRSQRFGSAKARPRPPLPDHPTPGGANNTRTPCDIILNLTMSCVPVAGDDDGVCANCGKQGSDTFKLKNCTACRLVKYCGVDCQRAHRRLHKKACKQRAAELKDEQLYSQGHERMEVDFCPICTLPIPLPTHEHSGFNVCCMKRICYGCDIAAKKRGTNDCAFCRTASPDNEANGLTMVMDRVTKKDPEGINFLAEQYFFGQLGLQKDMRKAVELYSEAAELGSVETLFSLGNAYFLGEGAKEDKKKAVQLWSKAAMQGHAESRHNLGAIEMERGNRDRA